ncbi:TolC family protein [Deinococcus fonticola]|uniref:TolC family protein n=1 Tax=Deinococcus fonticola TaxID=2528713 RepID=UPI001F105924|nr:TolC family protein [Deinococcus fonticola]
MPSLVTVRKDSSLALTLLSAALLMGQPAAAQAAPTTPASPGNASTQMPASGITLQAAITAALQNNADVRTAQANLEKASATNTAAQADPSVLVAAKLSARNAAALAAAQLSGARLAALQSTTAAFLAVLEGQESVSVQTLQVQADQKAVQVAQAKQQVGNATALDVQNAQNTLAASEQGLADARAQLALAQARLGTLTGLAGKLQVLAPDNVSPAAASLAQLQGQLPRLSALVAAGNAVSEAQLAVDLANNDYTPARTLADARTALANAQRSQLSAQQNAAQTLASAYQTWQNATELLAVAISREDAAKKNFEQDTARLQSGTISAVDLQATGLLLKKAQYTRLQAQGNVLEALAALSVAAGQNLSGVGGTL